MKKGALVVISAPAGSGKGTVIKHILDSKDNFVYSVSATTRNPRPGEQNGVQYYFVTREQFEESIRDGKMLEYASYCDNYYGTPRQAVEEKLSEGKNVILEIEVQGALKVKEKMPEALMIFILPPSYKILRERLVGRGTEDAETIEKRLLQAKEEISRVGEYHFAVMNENDASEKCAQSIINIVEGNFDKDAFKNEIPKNFYNE